MYNPYGAGYSTPCAAISERDMYPLYNLCKTGVIILVWHLTWRYTTCICLAEQDKVLLVQLLQHRRPYFQLRLQ